MLLRLYVVATVLYLMASGARRRRLNDGDLSVVYYRLGPPPWRRWRRRSSPPEPWILLHGLGSVAATWGRALHSLRRDCVLIVPELSVMGGSRAPGGALGLEEGARLAARLIEEELGGGPVTVAGLSMGAWMAMRLAQTRPELVARLVLVDAAGYREQDWDRIGSLVRVDDMPGVDRLYGAMFKTPPRVMRLSRAAFLSAYSSPSVRNLLDSLGESDTYRDADLARLAMPVALIWGEQDGLFTLEVARAMAAALPRSRFYVLRNCGHAVHLECPRALARALQQVRHDLPAGGEGSKETGRRSEGEGTSPSPPEAGRPGWTSGMSLRPGREGDRGVAGGDPIDASSSPRSPATGTAQRGGAN